MNLPFPLVRSGEQKELSRFEQVGIYAAKVLNASCVGSQAIPLNP